MANQSSSSSEDPLELHARQHGLEDYYKKYPEDLVRAADMIAKSRAALLRIEKEIASNTGAGTKR